MPPWGGVTIPMKCSPAPAFSDICGRNRAIAQEGLHFQDFRDICAAERTDFQSVVSRIPEGCPAGGWRSSRNSGFRKDFQPEGGDPAGIPEQL